MAVWFQYLRLDIGYLTGSGLTYFFNQIRYQLSDATYEKSFYQISIFSNAPNYGVHFDSVLNKYFALNAL